MLHFFARRLKELHEKDERGEKGFTLIELLVVVIIIGVLAAIAIPIFLAQRARADVAACESDLRNFGGAASGYLAGPGNGSFTGLTVDAAELQGFNPTEGVVMGEPAVGANGGSYVVTATCPNGVGTGTFDSDTGRAVVTEAA